MRIAIFHLAFVYAGGGERLVLEEAIAMQKRGHSVTCFAPIADERNCFPELLAKVKIKLLIPKLPSWIPDVELFTILAACLLTPLTFFRFRNFDIYFGANQPGAWIAYMLSKLNKKPYAIYLAQPTRLIHPRLVDQEVGLKIVDGMTLLNVLRLLFRPLINFCDVKSIRSADIVFTNGFYAKGLIEEVYGIKAINCPAGTHTKPRVSDKEIAKRFRGTVVISKKSIKKPYVLLTNRHFAHKKFEYAIEAVAKVNKELLLVITGKTTNYTTWLQQRIRNKKHLYSVGLLKEAELESAYKNASVYVYPSPEEDFGMGIVEAMAHGVPVVAWGNAGPTGIITHGVDGMLALPFVISDFAFCINTLLKNKVLYKKIAENAQRKVAKQFSYDRHAGILEAHLLKSIIG